MGAFPNLSRNVPFCPRLSSFVPIWGPESVTNRGQKRTNGDKTGHFGTNWETPPFSIYPHLALLKWNGRRTQTFSRRTFGESLLAVAPYPKGNSKVWESRMGGFQEGGVRNSWLAAFLCEEICYCKGTLTRNWHFACYCDVRFEDKSIIARTPPSKTIFPKVFPWNQSTCRKNR